MWPWTSTGTTVSKRQDEPTVSFKPISDEATKTISNVLGSERAAIVKEKIDEPLDALTNSMSRVERSLDGVPRLLLAVGCFALGGAVTTVLLKTQVHRFKRIRNADWLTPDLLDGKRVVKGVVTR